MTCGVVYWDGGKSTGSRNFRQMETMVEVKMARDSNVIQHFPKRLANKKQTLWQSRHHFQPWRVEALTGNRYKCMNILYSKQHYWFRILTVNKMFNFAFDRSEEGEKGLTFPLWLNRNGLLGYHDLDTSRKSACALHNGTVIILTISRGKSVMPEVADPCCSATASFT